MRRLSLAGALLIGTVAVLGPRAPAATDDTEREAEDRVHELRKEKRYKEALAYLDLAVKENPKSGNLRRLYCWIYLTDLKDPRTALDYALRLKKELPDHPGGYYWAARSYEAFAEYGKCVEALEDFGPHGKDFVRDNLKAGCYYKNRQYEEALASLPDEEKLGDNYTKYEGWSLWLKGQMARRKIFTQQKERLKAQAIARGRRDRAIALIKLGMLGLPECADLVEAAGPAEGGALKTVADSLKRELLAEPLFYKEKPRPGVPDDAKGVPVAQAFEQMWKELDAVPRPGQIPTITGKYMTKEMIEMAKKYPSFAQPMKIEVNETRNQFSLGAGWMTVDGEVDTSFEPGRWFTIRSVSEDAVFVISVGLQDKSTAYSSMAYRLNGKNIALETRSWMDMGDEFYLKENITPYLHVE